MFSLRSLPGLFFLASRILYVFSPRILPGLRVFFLRILPDLTYSLHVFSFLPYSSWPHVFSPCILLAYSLCILPGLTSAYSPWPHVFSLRILPPTLFFLASRILSMHSPCVFSTYSPSRPRILPGLTCSLYVVFLAYSSWPHVFSTYSPHVFSLVSAYSSYVFSLTSHILSTYSPSCPILPE